MRWLTLYLRSRRAPSALIAAVVIGLLLWTLALTNSDTRDIGLEMVVLTALLLVVALTVTLGGPDDDLEGTAAFAWLPRRAAHLLVAFLVVAGLLLLTQVTGARFGPVGLVLRDAAGLLGLTGLGAAVLGTNRAWFLPLGWTLIAILFPQTETAAGRLLTWQAQPPDSTAALVVAGVFAAVGLMAYAVGGPARRAPAEAAQHGF